MLQTDPLVAECCRFAGDLLEICCIDGQAQTILHEFAVDLLADRLYSKSTANPLRRQQIASKSTAFCHQRICLQHLDMSRCCRQIRCVASKSPANPFDMVQNGQIYS